MYIRIFFGPGDLSYMYTALSCPAANNKLHFDGEALRIRHFPEIGRSCT